MSALWPAGAACTAARRAAWVDMGGSRTYADESRSGGSGGKGCDRVNDCWSSFLKAEVLDDR